MVSKADQRRYAKLFAYGCICCRRAGYYSPPTMHHLVDKGDRAKSGGNAATLPLCPWHHQGIPGPGGKNATRALLGASLADGRKPFVAQWGTERALLAQVNEDLNVTDEGQRSRTVDTALD
jgi:hypothetical protein